MKITTQTVWEQCDRNSGWNRQLLACEGVARLTDFHAVNRTAGSLFIQLFDAVKVPPDGTVPIRTWEVLSMSSLDHDLPKPRRVRRGLLLVWSSTLDRLTTVATEDGLIDCNYEVLA